MPTFEIHTSFNAETMKQLKRIDYIVGETKKGIRRANYLIGKELVKDARKKILQGPKTGILYRIQRPSGRVVRHRASAPGEPPANFSGALRASVDFIVNGEQLKFGAGGLIQSGRLSGQKVEYAKDLELGNTKKKLKKRPYLKAAIDDSTKIATNYYRKEITKQLKGKVKLKAPIIK